MPAAIPEFWRPVFAYADLARLPELDFVVGDRAFGVYGHDWRVLPPPAWLELLGQREIALAPETVKPPPANGRWPSTRRPSRRQSSARCATTPGPTCCTTIRWCGHTW
jgi:hypothetical protein